MHVVCAGRSQGSAGRCHGLAEGSVLRCLKPSLGCSHRGILSWPTSYLEPRLPAAQSAVQKMWIPVLGFLSHWEILGKVALPCSVFDTPGDKFLPASIKCFTSTSAAGRWQITAEACSRAHIGGADSSYSSHSPEMPGSETCPSHPSHCISVTFGI